MDLQSIISVVTVFGLIGLGVFTVTSSYSRAAEKEQGEQLNQFLSMFLFKGLAFGIVYAVSTALMDSSSLYLLSVPVLVAGGFYINYLGSQR